MKKYQSMLLASALTICTVTSSSVMLGGSNHFVLAQDTVGVKASTEAEASTDNTTGTSEETTQSTTEKQTQETTESKSSSAQASTTKKDTTKKKEIQTKNKVKKLKKNKKLKEEKVVSNIIPKIYNDTRLGMKNQKEYIGKYIYFNQGDAAWNQNGYCIGKAGCGPTAMAVCISSLTGKWVTPLDTTIWAYNNGYYTNAGSSHDMIPALAKQYDLNCNGLATDYNQIKAALQAGHPVVALMGPGYFTKGGHFIVLVGIDDKDQVTVADVGSRERSSYKYTLKDVIGQSKAASAGGPFWEISSKSKAQKKKEVAVKKATKAQKQMEYRIKDLTAVLQSGYELAVPMKVGEVTDKTGFVTLTGIDSKGNVSILGKEQTVPVSMIVKELNLKAINGTFWEMVHPLQQNQKPTMSDYLMK